MDLKTNSPFSEYQEVEGGRQKNPTKKPIENRPSKKKTSFEPLYRTTDKYRRVIKPMKVEDFLTHRP
jgi:hypothetical protein